jgi:hypothetical protein
MTLRRWQMFTRKPKLTKQQLTRKRKALLEELFQEWEAKGLVERAGERDGVVLFRVK